MPGFIARVGAPLASIAVLGSIVLGGVSRTEAASIGVSWTAPTTNADGSPLRDLAGYRLYVGTSTPACPSGSFHSVSSPTASPGANQQVSNRLTGLVANTTYFARVTAVDGSGNESACSGAASGVAHTDVTVTPTTTVSFGSAATGTTVDRSFTVQNTSGASLSGSASVGAPYRILSGSPFTLAANATATVVVRFQPTSAGTFATNVNFSAAGDTLSRALSGSATGGAVSPPPSAPPPTSTGVVKVAITQPTSGATVRGSASVVLWAEGTSGSSNAFTLSAGGKVVGSQTTSSRGPVTIFWAPTVNGSTTLTASVRDAAGRTGSTSIQVNVQGATNVVTTPPPPPPPPASGTITVAITEPKNDTLVRRGATVTLWVNGTSGSANSFNLVANGKWVGGVNTSSRGPVQIPWKATVNGTNTLTAWVRDATGRTGSTTIHVWAVDASAAVTPPASDTLSVAMTQPAPGATVRSPAWTMAWVGGVSGSSNSNSGGPASIPWTTSVANGTYTLTAMVREAAGRPGRSSPPVTVYN
jgi:hypothetical protein